MFSGMSWYSWWPRSCVSEFTEPLVGHHPVSRVSNRIPTSNEAGISAIIEYYTTWGPVDVQLRIRNRRPCCGGMELRRSRLIPARLRILTCATHWYRRSDGKTYEVTGTCKRTGHEYRCQSRHRHWRSAWGRFSGIGPVLLTSNMPKEEGCCINI